MAYNVSITISLDLERDRDILAWLERQENRSAAVRKVLRGHIQSSTTLNDLYKLLKRLDGRIEAGVVSVSPGCEPARLVREYQTAPKFTAALKRLSEQSC